jgi:hypothetical protein
MAGSATTAGAGRTAACLPFLNGWIVDKCHALMSFEARCLVLASPWLLPTERPMGRMVGFAPTGDRRPSRRTEFTTHSEGYRETGAGLLSARRRPVVRGCATRVLC